MAKRSAPHTDLDFVEDFEAETFNEVSDLPDLPQIAADPEIAAMTAQLRRFKRGGQLIDLLLDRDMLRDYLRRTGYRDRPKGNVQSNRPRDDTLADRLERREKQLAEFGNDVSESDFPEIAAEAVAVFDDLTIRSFDRLLPFSLRDHDRKAGLEHLREIMRAAEGILFRAYDTVVRTKSRAAYEQVRPQYDALKIAIYRAMQELARAADRERDFQADFAKAGYAWPSDAGLPFMVANTLALIGSENPLSHPGHLVDFRRWLEDKGLIG